MKPLPPILRGDRLRLSAMLVANGIAQGASAFATALLIRHMFRRFSAPEAVNLEMLTSDFLIIGLVFVLAGIIALLRTRERIDAERLGQDYIHELRMLLFDQLTAVSPRRLQRRSRGGLMLRFVGDLGAVRNWVSLGIARLAVALLFAVTVIAVLAAINLAIAVSVTGFLSIGVVASLVLGRRMYADIRKARRRQSQLAANVNEKIGAMAVVQAFGQSKRERRRLSLQSERLKQALISRARSAGLLRGLAEATGTLATGAALLVGAWEISQGRADAGTIIATVVMVTLLAPRLRDLGRVYEYWTGAVISRGKIEKFLADPRLEDDRQNAPKLTIENTGIEFRNVSVSNILRNATATASPGSVVAIVGPNGAGKSTLISLILRMLTPDSGKILISGKDISNYSIDSVRRLIGIVSPDLPLLRGTVGRNLIYRRRRVSGKRLDEIIVHSGVDRILAELPDGIDTRVHEGGTNLSLGQRQCIALARALLGRPKILLLDETDAHLDPIAQEVLLRVIDKFSGTVLVITHRSDLIAMADQVWHLRGGRVVECGAPDDLLGKRGPTANLFKTKMALTS